MALDERLSEPYTDIMGLSRPLSKNHPPMKRQNRAAQFAPFAALTGLDDAMEHTARENYHHMEYDEIEIIDGETFRNLDK